MRLVWGQLVSYRTKLLMAWAWAAIRIPIHHKKTYEKQRRHADLEQSANHAKGEYRFFFPFHSILSCITKHCAVTDGTNAWRNKIVPCQVLLVSYFTVTVTVTSSAKSSAVDGWLDPPRLGQISLGLAALARFGDAPKPGGKGITPSLPVPAQRRIMIILLHDLRR